MEVIIGRIISWILWGICAEIAYKYFESKSLFYKK